MLVDKRMQRGPTRISMASNKYHRRRSSVIVLTGERVVSVVRVATTAVLLLWKKTLRPRSCGRKDSIAWRTARSSFHVMCRVRPVSYQHLRAWKPGVSLRTAP
jgi:hypothetical protein